MSEKRLSEAEIRLARQTYENDGEEAACWIIDQLLADLAVAIEALRTVHDSPGCACFPSDGLCKLDQCMYLDVARKTLERLGVEV